jgi:hypothetical protein
MLILADESRVRGALMCGSKPMSKSDLAAVLGTDTETISAVLDCMIDLDVIEYDNGLYYFKNYCNWAENDKYQDVKNKRNARQRKFAKKTSLMTKAVLEGNEPLIAYLSQKNTDPYNIPEDLSGYTKTDVKPADKKEKPDKDVKQASVEAVELAEQLAAGILSHSPDFRTLTNGKKAKTLLKYAKAFDLMITRDNRNIEEIKKVIVFATGDTKKRNGFCWAPYILSADKLREKYDSLILNLKSEVPTTTNGVRRPAGI